MVKNKKSSKPQNRPKTVFRERRAYTSLRVKGFRRFESINLKKLSNINIFVGPNNTGKSSLLEAIYTHACGRNFAPLFSQILLRRTDGMIHGIFDLGDHIISLFNDKASLPLNFLLSAKLQGIKKSYNHRVRFYPSGDLSALDPRSFGQTIDISADHSFNGDLELSRGSYSPSLGPDKAAYDVTKKYLGTWKTNSEGEEISVDLYFPFPFKLAAETPFKLASMIGLLDHRDPNRLIKVFSHLKRYEILEEFGNEMKMVFPEVNSVDSIPFPDGSFAPLYIQRTDGQKLPIYSFGDGVRRWFLILGEIIIHRKCALCVEEVDSSFHPSSHRPLSKKLHDYALKYGAQLFLSTHNYEFVDIFLNTIYGSNGIVDPSGKDPVQVFTLTNSEDGLPVLWEITGREAFEQREKFKLELLG